MNVCERCGDEITTKDGENLCAACEEDTGVMNTYDREKARRRDAARERRSERDEVMHSLGLTKVRGAMGGTYWE